MTAMATKGPARARVVAAFAAVYLIWGSTYLAIRYAIETLPPFLMAGVRFVVAGVVLYAWARWRGAGRPRRREWLAATVIGGLLLLGGNGGVVWAEQWVASGIASLIVATVPLWMVLFDWQFGGGVRPSGRVAGGVVLGLVGVALLIGPAGLVGASGVHPLGAGVLVLASLSWAAGSIYSRGAVLPASPFLATAMEMVAGGALLVLAGLATGEAGRLALDAVSLRSLIGFVYLIVFGSLVGFTSYIWLLRVAEPARVATYAYVNPAVAVFLGWALADEPLTPRMLLAAAVIIASVAVITAARTRQGKRPMERPETATVHPTPAGVRTLRAGRRAVRRAARRLPGRRSAARRDASRRRASAGTPDRR